MSIGALSAQSPVRQNSGAEDPGKKKIQMLEKKQEQIQEQIRRIKQDKSLSKEDLQKKIADLEKQLENVNKQIQDAQQSSPAQANAAQDTGKKEPEQKLSELETAQQVNGSHPVSALDELGLEQVSSEGTRPGRFDQFVKEDPMAPSPSGVYQLQRDEDGTARIISGDKKDSLTPVKSSYEQEQEKEKQLPEDLLAMLREKLG